MLSEQKAKFHCAHASAVQAAMPGDTLCAHIAGFYQIFSDSSRIKILFAMLEQEICVHDIALITRMSQSSVSHQLRLLRQQHVVKVRRQGKLSYYALDDEHIHAALTLARDHLGHTLERSESL